MKVYLFGLILGQLMAELSRCPIHPYPSSSLINFVKIFLTDDAISSVPRLSSLLP